MTVVDAAFSLFMEVMRTRRVEYYAHRCKAGSSPGQISLKIDNGGEINVVFRADEVCAHAYIDVFIRRYHEPDFAERLLRDVEAWLTEHKLRWRW